ncbi:E3 ubiquitin-protein ligase RNF144A isoform X1 [Rhinopithecus roxellana]|uniref:E3 ubiquitin-protein ligase RNF144A isoform X1 n=1 Tax=Rhinopithecus roxellana TaxID=61622 RepID=UPI0012379487|nr:E3 ubiquitin-protein ligase RNF144A isoform X1 [Rhinopithecus roxellana]
MFEGRKPSTGERRRPEDSASLVFPRFPFCFLFWLLWQLISWCPPWLRWVCLSQSTDSNVHLLWQHPRRHTRNKTLHPSVQSDCSAMTTARYRPTWDLALDPLVSCKLCLGEYPVEQMTTIAQCQCIFCTLCLKQYVELLIKEGLETAISCPDAACPKQGHLQENEIECMVAAEIMQRYKKLQFEREVLFDPCRTWCPASTCQAVCQLQDVGLQTPQPVQCKACHMEFCSTCKASWHPGQGCPETMPITFLPGETSAAFKMEEDDAPIKRCPKCRVYIERDEGCAQMMCKNCKHAFCWYCLESLDDDFLLIHYDKGPCRNKLGHSRASVIWHRTQVVGIFAGFGLLLLVASPFLLLATPFVLCCKCKCSKGDDDPLPT